ncbi:MULTISPECIES: site-2 protease family protein [Turicibacter]|uniref:site-2 protease family protein n=1 Tax=Turicibacter TaxID=191303 RepID=UPI0001FDAFBF|nr:MULTISPECIES: site-2 protease family protein [Turicibacter]EGC92560.1 peptidase, M50 family [Turicibacter sp. HGF1]MCU7196366.1 site-2 protease family protein [Turicibacter sanguinis]
MPIFLYIVIAYLSIFIHECGHYFAAYLFGVKATDVVTGMGIKILSIKTAHTRFIFKLFPSGGVTIYDLIDENKLNSFQQIIILLAGSTFNYITAVIASTLYYQTNLIEGFKILNQLISRFIISLTSMLSVHDFLIPDTSFTESIEIIANENTLQQYALFIILFMNVLLFLFNLIPIPFFDGGQIVSILLDPFLIKFGLHVELLEQIKTIINQAIGYFLVFLIVTPFLTRWYQNMMLSSNPKSELLKWILILLGAILLKRIFNTLSHLIRSNKI